MTISFSRLNLFAKYLTNEKKKEKKEKCYRHIVVYFIRNSIGITLEHVFDRFNARLNLRN